MTQSLASAITRAASKQTYYTIRFLVDPAHVDNAYRAYAYFRWVDDVLDADARSGPVLSQAESLERQRFLDRQKSVLEHCLLGAAPRDPDPHEIMLFELVQREGNADTGLRAYLRNMMFVMDFDVRRRGRLISQLELNEYTRWLAIAVTEAMHHFIGNDASVPHDGTRYLAASGAHIMHMLRDTYDDVRLGYYNVPREVLEAGSITPLDVHSETYRGWVKGRVQLARACFDAGKCYFARVQNWRHRLAGLAYMARFEWLTETLEREDFELRPWYSERNSPRTALRMTRYALASMISLRALGSPSVSIAAQPEGKV